MVFNSITAVPYDKIANTSFFKNKLQHDAISEKTIKNIENQQKDYLAFVEKLKKQTNAQPQFVISNTNLSKTEFLGCDLRGFEFLYCNSKLSEAFITGSELPKNNIDIYDSKNSSPDGYRKMLIQQDTFLEQQLFYFKQKTSVYTQLKKVFTNQGNIVEAGWYHSKAMKFQEKLLDAEVERRKKVEGTKSLLLYKETLDKWVFKLNHLSNRHGESWAVALRFVVISSLVLYSVFYASLYYKYDFSFDTIWHFVGNYFTFINPTHKINYMTNELTACSKFVDFISRIVIGYGIYQFVVAFRRHGKK